MRVRYLKERAYHTPASLRRALGLDEERGTAFIRDMCARGVLSVRGDGQDEGAPEELEPGKLQVTWVGLVLWGDLLVVAYPKYMSEDPKCVGGMPDSRMQTVLAAVRRHNAATSDLALPGEEPWRNDRLALLVALLEAYGRDGLYSNHVRAYRENGGGAVSWERTIARSQPFDVGGVPVYLDLVTVERERDDADLVRRLHEAVLTEASAFLERSGVGALLGLAPVELTDTAVSDLGDADALLALVERERAQQFADWKVRALEMLSAYLSQKEAPGQAQAMCLGTSSFHVVWEEACKVHFGDQLGMRLRDLGMELQGEWKRRGSETLLDIVPRPQWTTASGRPSGQVSTLIPDVVTIRDLDSGGKAFCIYDAKYYTPKLGSATVGVPGVESVTKQFLYQAAYKGFVLDHGFEQVQNVFLVPTEGAQVRMGSVEFPGVFERLREPFSNEVTMVGLNALDVLESYVAR